MESRRAVHIFFPAGILYDVDTEHVCNKKKRENEYVSGWDSHPLRIGDEVELSLDWRPMLRSPLEF